MVLVCFRFLRSRTLTSDDFVYTNLMRNAVMRRKNENGEKTSRN
jgi:hypothetical protein